MMKNKSQYLVRGLLRLTFGGLVIALALLAFNVVGYHLILNDLVILGEPNNWPSSYFGRALLLSFIGFIQLGVWAIAVALGGVVLFLAYYGILYVGGYREDRVGAC